MLQTTRNYLPSTTMAMAFFVCGPPSTPSVVYCTPWGRFSPHLVQDNAFSYSFPPTMFTQAYLEIDGNIIPYYEVSGRLEGDGDTGLRSRQRRVEPDKYSGESSFAEAEREKSIASEESTTFLITLRSRRERYFFYIPDYARTRHASPPLEKIV